MSRLGDVAEVRGRVGWKGYTVEDLTDDGPLVLGANDITSDNRLSLANVKHLTREKYEESPEIFVELNDVLVVKVGSTIGKVCIIDDEIGEASINPNCVIVRAKDINPYYLYYFLCTPTGRAFLINNSVASGQPALNQTNLKKLEIPEMDQMKQEKTIGVLNAIKKCIVINEKIIEASEKLMREIYDYWFVQFDFPDENGRPYKSSGGEMVYDETLKREIPKGWRVLELGDIIKEAKKSPIQVNGARERAGAYPFFTSGDEILDFDEYYVDGFNIFLNTGGNADIKSYYGKSAYSTDTWCISADEYSYMLFIFLDSIKEQINNNCFAGSGLKHLQKNAFKKIKIVTPDDNLLRAFNDLAQSFHQAISSYKAENKKLASLRDWLLPMLMNGQISIK